MTKAVAMVRRRSKEFKLPTHKTCKRCGKFGENLVDFCKHAYTCRKCCSKINMARQKLPKPPKATEKTCRTCGITGPIEMFRPGRRMCKACLKNYYYQYAKEARATCPSFRKRCKEATIAYQKRRPETAREYRKAHREDGRRAFEKWKANNPEKFREAFKKYLRSPKGRATTANTVARRKQRIKNAGRITSAELLAVRAAAKGVCHYCRKKVTKLTYDHVIPLAKGGAHAVSNLVMACGPCNFSKQATMPEDFAQKLGLLLI